MMRKVSAASTSARPYSERFAFICSRITRKILSTVRCSLASRDSSILAIRSRVLRRAESPRNLD